MEPVWVGREGNTYYLQGEIPVGLNRNGCIKEVTTEASDYP
jgi:hypothetical protein